MHDSAGSGSERSSPSLRAISAIDLSMMIVDTGSSMGSVAKPKAPPAAPDAVAKALCRSCDPGVRCIVPSATLRAASRPLAVAVAIARETAAGSALLMRSIGLPTRLVRRAARPGCSSNRTAVRSAARSSGVMVGPGLVAIGALLDISVHTSSTRRDQGRDVRELRFIALYCDYINSRRQADQQ